jgi:NTE family protein
MAPKKAATTKRIDLALQGGGAHGAFTWGVLDRLLEDGRLEIEAISGTSAGAMNAVVAADGMMNGGTDGARQALWHFWKSMSAAAQFSPFKRTIYDVLIGNWNLSNSPGYLFMDLVSRVASPYELNPLSLNPLKDFLMDNVNFERVRGCDKMKLFIAATCVQTGKVRIFERSELTADMVMASACLPSLYPAVTIDGQDYWDGGFAGNPPLYPFAYRCTAADVLLVQINPVSRQETPKKAGEILNRVNEITFNANLLHELRAIDFVDRMLDEGSLDPNRYKKIYIHAIQAGDSFKHLNASSKLNAEWDFLIHLHDIGQLAAQAWLEQHFDDLGHRSTLDLYALLH